VIFKIRHIYKWLFLVLILTDCTVDKTSEETVEIPNLTPLDAAISWAELTIDITKNTPANSPTYASRALGYIGLTMYESVVHGYPPYKSIGNNLNGLIQMPKPELDEKYEWIFALNAGQAEILRFMYNQTSDENKSKIDSLEQYIFNQFKLGLLDEKVVERSVHFGKEIATSIFEWSKSDGGHRGYLKNFDKNMTYKEHAGSWKPPLYAQSFSHYPLHPYWGENRTFLKENTNLPLPEIIPYDTIVGSPYYNQFLAVYEKEMNLTQEEKEIAIWWGDDPSDTFTPPGHSYYLATLAVKQAKPSLIKCSETYARVGLAVADAFINCWKWKYHFFMERPNTYIPNFIDQEWESFWPDPPFPSFPSGHAIQAAASATVLEDLYGPSFNFVDSSHVGRERDEQRNVDFKPREFSSFWEVAEETANSRFFGGIHTYHDNKVGLDEGKKIANHVNLIFQKANPK
jgi:hypothetical protein